VRGCARRQTGIWSGWEFFKTGWEGTTVKIKDLRAGKERYLPDNIYTAIENSPTPIGPWLSKDTFTRKRTNRQRKDQTADEPTNLKVDRPN
jgi:hypothetical protein